MSLLLSILRAAHCRSMHHFFAIDAIPLVQTEPGKRLVSHLLRHHRRYLTGAQDPDKRFCDFQNHVVHVTDGYWGGAPRVAHAWYDRMQRYLRSGRYGDAAHAAGVLSHYFTDPMMPLHTQQCEQEKILHRPIEWSITKSYETILQAWRDNEMRVVFQLSNSNGWLGEAILHGARFANRSYHPLLNTYDLQRGSVDPPSGLSLIAHNALAELFGLAITGWARVIERAALDAESALGRPLPATGASIPTAIAAINAPSRLWLRRIENKLQRQQISQLVSEFRRTGTLREHLPKEVDIVHRVVQVHQEEKRWTEQRTERAARASASASKEVTDVPLVFAMDESQVSERPATIPFVAGPARRGRLAAGNPIVDAPSIGPKTSDRFVAVGIETIGQFLDASAQELAAQLQTYWINAATIKSWQSQTNLMCQVPGLRARDAQLLAGAGCVSARDLTQSNPLDLYKRIGNYATTSAGRRYLRGAAEPILQDVQRWIRHASESEFVKQDRNAA